MGEQDTNDTDAAAIEEPQPDLDAEQIDDTDESLGEDDAEGTDDAGNDAADTPLRKARKEAAGYRERLRTTESERDTLAGQLATMQRQAITALAAERLSNGADLLTFSGDDLSGFLTDDGAINPDAVSTAVDALLTTRAYLGKRRKTGAFGGGAKQQEQPKPLSWSDALSV